MRRLFLVLVGLLAAAYVAFSLAELEGTLVALEKSKPLYLFAAVAVEGILLVNTTATFWALYRLVGLRESGKNLFWMISAATFVNLITPSSGVGGLAVFLDDARWRGQPVGRVTAAAVLYLLYEYIALFVAIAAGFVVLARLGKLNGAELTAAGFLLLLAAAVGVGVVLEYRSSGRLGHLLARIATAVNHIVRAVLHKEPLRVASLYRFAADLGDGMAGLHKAGPGPVLLPLLFTLFNKVLLILVLGLAFLALGVTVDGGTVLAGFSVGHLFVYASPTPSGIGFVEGILPMALNSLDVPLLHAVLVSLVYRGVTLWLPLAVGALAFRRLQRSHIRQERQKISEYA